MGEPPRSVTGTGHAALFNLVHDAVFLHLPVEHAEDLPSASIVDANKAACAMLGYSREELLALTVGDIDRGNAGPIPEHQLAALRAGEQLRIERLVTRKDGALVPVEVQSSRVDVEGGVFVLASVRDISERRRLQSDLEQQRMLFRRILEAAPTGVVWVNRAGEVTFANRQAEACLQLSRRENAQLRYDDPGWYITDFDGHPFPAEELPFARVKRTREPAFGVEHAITVDGVRTLLSISAVPLFALDGEFDGIVAVIADVTDRVRTERALENSERYLRDVIDAIQDGISVLDRDLTITRANRTIEKWYPHALPLVGQQCHAAYHGNAAPCDPCPSRRALESGQLESNTVPLAGPDGVHGWLDVHAFPLRDAGGRVAGVVEYVRDVTQQREAQRLLGLQRDLAATLSSVDDFDEALEVLLDVVVTIPQIDGVTLTVRRPDGSYQVVGSRGLRDSVVADGVAFPLDRTWTRSLDRAEPFYQDARQGEIPLAEGDLDAVGLVPIAHEGRVIGSLIIASRSGSQFDPSVRSTIETIASQVGGALGRIRAQTELQRSADTQAVLLREVNHRVKNNLAAIISILHKEQDRAEVADQQSYLGLLREMVARVAALATVHRLLSESQWRPLPLDGLVRSVVEAVVRAHKSPERVEVRVGEADVTVESDIAHHVGLVLNELATNCLKHGLVERERLRIGVALERIEGEIRIRFADDGPGFPQEVLIGAPSTGLGLELVRGIVRRTLRGTVRFDNRAGAVVELQFKAGAG